MTDVFAAGVEPAVLVHGGAGPMKNLAGLEEEKYRAGLLRAAREGLAVLHRGGSALDAVEEAVRSMEECGDFNAGAGACLDEEGRATLDAAIMRGSDLAAGAVAAVQATHLTVSLARSLLEEGRHVLLVGEGADRRARSLGFAPMPPIDDARKKALARMLAQREKSGHDPEERLAATSRPSARLEAVKGGSGPLLGAREDPHDTVGAVAVDGKGRVAAATSTGGLWLKAPFRVGDSAIPGGGLYASDRLGGAASATGIGERIMKVTLCKEACDFLGSRGGSAQEAAEHAISILTDRFGGETGGLIVVDRRGEIGAAFDTRAMGRAFARGAEARVAVWRDEAF